MNNESFKEKIFSFLSFYDESMVIAPIGEYKSNECDEFLKKCIGNISDYTSLVEGRIGVMSFKTYLKDEYLYVVCEDACIGLDMNTKADNRKIRLFRNIDNNFYDYQSKIYSNDTILKQIIGDNIKVSEIITPVSSKNISSNGFLGLIGMNIPNQYYSEECKKILYSSDVYRSKYAIEYQTEDGKITVNTKSYWINKESFSSKQLPPIIEFDLVMPNKFQKSMYVIGDDGKYSDLYNYSGLSLTYDELSNLLSESGIDIKHTNEFIFMTNTKVEIPEKLNKLCKIVNIAKIAQDSGIEVNFATIGEEN